MTTKLEELDRQITDLTAQAQAIAAELAALKAQQAAPEPPALRYKPGDVVLVPMVVDRMVIEVDYPYYVHSLGGGKMDKAILSRKALEPPRPQVGQKVVAFDGQGNSRVGILEFDDNSTGKPVKQRPFMVRVDDDECDWFYHAYALPAED